MESKVNTLKATDGLGQEIQVGDKVVWLAGSSAYGGVTIYLVRGITAKRVAVSSVDAFKRYPECRPTYAAHDVVVVINKLLNEHDEIEV